MAENLKDTIRRRAPAVDFIVGTFEKFHLPEMVEGDADISASDAGDRKGTEGFDGYSNTPESASYHFQGIHSRRENFSAFVPIMHGCDNFCSYCIVPYVRGREVSRLRDEIFRELELLQDRGVKEVTLLGQNVNSYVDEGGEKRFPGLLREIARRFPRIGWIRFLTSHPKDFSPKLIEVIGEHETICNHVHLPVQHGSDRVLERMNRRYTRNEYIRLTDELRDAVPGVSLSTDILIGFPGETEEDFLDTLALLERVRFDDAFTYKYNIRTGTRAASFPDQLPEEVKGERLARIIEKQRIIGHNIKKESLATRRRLLLEQISKKNPNEVLGRTAGNNMVVIPGTAKDIGSFVEARLTSLEGNTFRGEPIR
jgi:tRNA-2-methylthio-N6-dimethylallyladenosine synthase